MKGDQDFFDFMDGFCMAWENLAPCAHTEACKQGVISWNQETGEHRDPFANVLKWKKARTNGRITWSIKHIQNRSKADN